MSVASDPLPQQRSIRAQRLLIGLAGALAVAALALALAPQATAQMPPAAPPAPLPSNCNYVIDNSIPFQWVEISGNGTPMGAWVNDWASSWISHSPPFYGYICTSYGNNFLLSAKGHFCVAMTQSAAAAPACGAGLDAPGPLPHNTAARPAVWGFFADLHPGLCPGGNGGSCIFHSTFGTAPNRWFLYEFLDVPYFAAAGNVNSFQMRLYEATGCIETHYLSTTASGTAWPRNAAGYNGNTGTPTSGWEYGYSASGLVLANQAWRACPQGGLPPICTPAATTIGPGAVTVSAMLGQAPYTWDVSPSTNVLPASGSGSTFTPNFGSPGTYSVRVTGANGKSATCTVNVVLPGCGYTISEIPFEWDDISLTGTPLAHGDLTSFTVNLNTAVTPPLPFRFCDVDYTSLRLVSKGYICLGVASNCATSFGACCNLPSPSLPRPAIFGYFADIFPGGCRPVGVRCTFWEVLGPPGERRFVYEFRNVPNWPSTSSTAAPDTAGPLTFEIKLFEGSNCIEVHYKVINPGNFARVVAGYQNAAGTAHYAYWSAAPGFNTVTNPGPPGPRAWRACPQAFVFNEDQQAQLFDPTVGDNLANLPFQVVSWTDPAKGTLVRAGGRGNFTYTPLPDKNGPDSFTYTIRNTAGLTATRRANLFINAVNDPPTFQVDSAPLVIQPAKVETLVAGWATLVRPAPPTATDEATQGIRFVVSSNSNPLIFDEQPTVVRTASDSSTAPVLPPTSGEYGLLRFKASGVFGESTVCVRAFDTGGNATVRNTWQATATGQALGPPQCVTIVVNSPPVAYFEPTSAKGRLGQRVTFDPCPGPVPRCTHDAEGALAVYLWEFGDGATSNEPGVSHAYHTSGSYLVTLNVWDSYGLTARYSRDFQVDPPDAQAAEEPLVPVAPVADAGEDRTVLEGQPVQLAGRQVGGSEAALFEWRQDGGPPVPLSDVSSPMPTFTAPRLASQEPLGLRFALRVRDGGLESAEDFVDVLVVSANAPPLANAGGEATVAPGETVRLDGSGSSDPDGDTLSYQWTQLMRPGDVSVRLSDPSAPDPSLAAPDAPGTLLFRLRVSDGRAASEDVVVVTVQPRAPAQEEPAQAAAAAPPARVAAEVPPSPGPSLSWLPAAAAAMAIAALAVAFVVLRRSGRR